MIISRSTQWYYYASRTHTSLSAYPLHRAEVIALQRRWIPVSGEIPMQRYAGFADRSAAFIIDAVIILTLFLCLQGGAVYAGSLIGPILFGGTAAAFTDPAMPVYLGNTLASAALLFLFCWLYSAILTSSLLCGTVGKRVLGLAVTDFEGSRLSFLHATIRFIAKIFAGLIFLIGFFMIHYSEKKQGLHDRFAGTYVVYLDRADNRSS
jgi:uncharacterized RDD family membrane protein YckC